MPSDNSVSTIELATNAAERIVKNYSKTPASDPKIFLAGMIQILASYPDWLILRAPDALFGIPAQCKFCPPLAEMKEIFDGWLAEHEQRERRAALAARPALPAPPRQPIPDGQDYVSMVKKHGRPIGRFEAGTPYARYAGMGGQTNPNTALVEKIAREAREAMEANRRRQEAGA